jgi:hypothetical protein
MSLKDINVTLVYSVYCFREVFTQFAKLLSRRVKNVYMLKLDQKFVTHYGYDPTIYNPVKTLAESDVIIFCELMSKYFTEKSFELDGPFGHALRQLYIHKIPLNKLLVVYFCNGLKTNNDVYINSTEFDNEEYGKVKYHAFRLGFHDRKAELCDDRKAELCDDKKFSEDDAMVCVTKAIESIRNKK